MKKLSLLIVTFIIGASGLFAQIVVPFVQRYSTTQKGNIDFVSNTIVKCDGSGGGGANCGNLDTASAPTVFSWSQNNDHRAEYVDIDSDPTTFSSSSDSLNLSSCSEVLFAEIYWGARRNSGDAQYANRNTIKLGVNGGAYTTVTADNLFDNTTGYTSYHCRADITTLVQANPIKSIYTVADMYAELDGHGRWGAWNIVVVYRNDLQTMRNLTVYDGIANVQGATNVDINVSGFLTPPSGPVTFDIGVFAYDGDRGFTGDQLLFDGGSGFTNISDALNPVNDVFNFTSSIRGVNSTSQNPLFLNNISYDADIFAPDNSLKNLIGNSATSATIRETTGGETILSQVITMAIDVFEPDIRAAVSVQDLNGGMVQPGDTLEYTVRGINIGSDPSVDTYIVDTLEQNADFVPGSINIIYGANMGVKSDATGDDQGEYIAAAREVRVRIGTGANAVIGGQVNNSPAGTDSTVFTFRVTATSDCIILACDNIVDNSAHIFGTGIVSGNVFSNASNPGIFDANGCPLPGTTSTPIDASLCVPLPDTSLATCATTSFTASLGYPGYTYYNGSFMVVTEPSSIGTYYAIKAIYSGCADTVVITVTSVANCDSDGDGVPDTDETADGTDPNDPCDYNPASQVITNVSAAWNALDCDGDGVDNGTEVTDGTDPNDPCDFVAANITLPTLGWDATDCDGDGVTNGTEVTDGTDPNDPCDFITANITLPTLGWNAADCDGDGVDNGTEVTDGTDPNDPCDYIAANQTLPVGTLWDAADCDGDGVDNGTEVTDGTDPNDPCDFITANITLPTLGWNAADCDGDGVDNGTEVTDGTDPNDPCDFVAANITLPTLGWNAADCDGDGVTNGDETTDGTDPNDPCDLTINNVSIPATNNADCDGDGVTNADEINGADGDPLTTEDNTDPNDPCDFNKNQITVTVTSNVICDNGLHVPEGFSPNGDGVNDVFVITGLSQYPNHSFMIFNRWGNKIYEASPYNNDWDGINHFGVTVGGNILPIGTYFYIIELGDDSDPIKGYIYLNR